MPLSFTVLSPTAGERITRFLFATITVSDMLVVFALIHTAALARWGKVAYNVLNRFNGFPKRSSDCDARANR